MLRRTINYNKTDEGLILEAQIFEFFEFFRFRTFEMVHEKAKLMLTVREGEKEEIEIFWIFD